MADNRAQAVLTIGNRNVRSTVRCINGNVGSIWKIRGVAVPQHSTCSDYTCT